jgi:pyrroloquinoline-quinone synthase
VSQNLWQRIEEQRERWNVLKHPFYARWSAGELSPDELSYYSGQYRHAVMAIAAMSAGAAEEAPPGARAELRAHAEEEASHLALWDGFCSAVDGDPQAGTNAETHECVQAWTARDGLLSTLTRLYAIESGQPAISTTKREGLLSHYGVEDGPGTAYFRLHAELDTEHAAGSRRLIEELAEDSDEDELVSAAESAFRANWRLLDGVQDRFGPANTD